MKLLRFGVAALAVSVLAMGLFGLNNAEAAALTWNNGASNLLWDTTSTNWGGATTWNNTTPDSATFGATGVGTISLNEAITAGGITFSTAGYTLQNNTLTLKAATAGATTLTANESATINSAIALSTNSQLFSVAASKTLTLGGSVNGGNFNLTKNGSGTLTLGGAVSNIGSLVTDNSGGTIAINSGASLSATSLNGGTGANSKVNITSAGDLTISGSFHLNNNVNGAVTFTQTAGTVTLSSSTDDVAVFGSGISIAFRVGATTQNPYKLQGGVLNVLNTTLYVSNGGAANGLLNITGGTANLKGAALSGASSSAIGAISVTGGRLNLGSSGLSNGTTTSGSSTVTLGAATIGAFADWSSSKAMILSNAATGVTFDTLDSVDNSTARTITLSSALSSTGSLIKTGAGTLTLSNAGNTFSGAVTVNGGILVGSGASGNTNTALGLSSGSRTITVNNTGTLKLSGNNVFGSSTQTLANTIKVVINAGGTMTTDNFNVVGNIDLNGATLTATAGSSANYQTYEFNGSTITIGGSAASTISSSASSSGGMHIAGGTTLALDVGDVAIGTDLTISAALINGSNDRTGAGGLTKAGAGTLNLSGSNTYSGGTTVNAGTLTLGHASGLGSGAVSLNGGTLNVGGYAVANNIVLGGGALAFNGATLNGVISESGTRSLSVANNLTLNNQNAYTGGTTITAGTLTLGHGSNTLNDSGAVTVNGGALAIGANSDTVGAVTLTSGGITGSTGVLTGSSYDVQSGTVSAKLGGSGVVLTKNSSGTVVLSGSNAYTGGTVVNAGTLQAGDVSAFGTGAIDLNAGTLDFANLGVSTVVNFKGGTLINAGNRTGASNVKTGATLDISSTSTGSGAVTVESGATLKGVGTIAGMTTINDGGTHAPGNSPGTETFTAGLTYDAGSTLVWEFSSNAMTLAGTDYDTINVTGGDLTITGVAYLKIMKFGDAIDYTSSAWDSNRAFTVINFTSGGTSVGNFTLDPLGETTIAGQGSWSVLRSGNNIDVAWTVIPEPGTAGVMMTFLVAALLRKRRFG